MSGLYGDMTDEELNFWERLPLVMQVLSTPQFGCWLIRRDKNREQSADVRPNVHGEWAKICWKAFRCSECKKISEYYTDFCV